MEKRGKVTKMHVYIPLNEEWVENGWRFTSTASTRLRVMGNFSHLITSPGPFATETWYSECSINW
jgi:hypothetical protein